MTASQNSDPKALLMVDRLIQAIRNGDETAARALIPQCDPRLRQSEALWMAAKKGRFECVALLIPVSDVSARSFEAVGVAAQEGHPDCLRLLLAACDPGMDHSSALADAAFGVG